MINILDTSNGLDSILAFLSNVIKIIRIAIPIGLILFVSIDLAKAVLSRDDEALSKCVKSIRNRVIASILIFFLPVIVEFLLFNVSTSLNMNAKEYKRILSSFKKVINSSSINVNDDTKDKDISNDMKYSINTNSDDISNNEKITNISKLVTNTLFNKDSVDIYSNALCNGTCNINYNGKNITNKFYLEYKELVEGDVINNNNYIVSSIILNNAVINDKEKYSSVIIDYHYKFDNNKYVLETINIESKDKIDDYVTKLNDNELNNIGGINKYISSNYNYSKLNNLNDNEIDNIYSKGINDIVMINTYFDSAVVSSGSGFFLSNGVVVTSWSFIKKSLMNGQTIIVHDINKNSYKVSGLVTFDINSDIAVIKLNKEVRRMVTLGDYKKLVKDDPVITITSKTGYGLTTITGILNDNSTNIVSVIPLKENDWGSPLFNKEGQVIGMNTSKSISSELSVSSPVINLKELQSTLNNTNFNDIKIKDIEDLKKEYYYTNVNKETISNKINKNIWKKYKKIGNIEDSIALNLVKASYYDKVISLRYENTINDYVSSMSFASEFISNLESDGYKKILDTSKKKLYKKGNTKVIIMEEFNYLIIVLAKESII